VQPSAKPANAASCAGPRGEPARLEVHPGKKLMRTGESFVFRAIVRDGDGCPLAIAPSWSVRSDELGDKATVTKGGKLTLADDAAEGSVELRAAVRGRFVS